MSFCRTWSPRVTRVMVTIPMRGNESDSQRKGGGSASPVTIPMRGNEQMADALRLRANRGYDPHEG